MRTPARRRLAAAALVLLVPVLGACGFGYQTDQVYQPGVGTDSRSGTVEVLGAVIVSDTKGTGTFVASMVNSSDTDSDQLTGVTATGAQATLASPIDIGSDDLVNLADQGAVGITGDSVDAGNFVRVQLSFKNGQKTSMNVPVVAKDGEYDSVKLAPSSPAASPSASPTP
jgi:hypothetical protein